MSILKKGLVCLGTGTLIVAAAGLVAPRAAYALVATLVQVANTTSNPAITLDTSKAASQNVELECHVGTNAISLNCIQVTPDAANAGDFAAPAGQKFVITTVDLTFVNGATPAAGRTSLNLLQNGTIREFWQFDNATAQTQLQFLSGIVIAPGYHLQIQSTSSVSPSPGTYITIHGYLTSL